ncbi:hypothetical protein QCM77_35595 [Bradyrhizobium sp. SSUT18]|uniref:hypothetical protein n=1 Tax=Bradyrhizobium sp. SSUT18 TaxID=3040602 RepID=UPI002446D4B9|nr:hypothetical protein [Bradyrhizobium sp. SSUT18]MDH2405192.1 hypothetical protein [Bradyrhizobium sp. SSUT18]
MKKITLCSSSKLLIAVMARLGKSPESLIFPISTPMRAARLTTSVGGMTLSIEAVSFIAISSKLCGFFNNKG